MSWKCRVETLHAALCGTLFEMNVSGLNVGSRERYCGCVSLEVGGERRNGDIAPSSRMCNAQLGVDTCQHLVGSSDMHLGQGMA